MRRLGHSHTGDSAITAIAFADDLVLLSDSWESMVTIVTVLEANCQLTGLKVQPRFLVEKKAGKSLSINTRDPWVDRTRWPGVEVNPWMGIVSEDLSAKIYQGILAILDVCVQCREAICCIARHDIMQYFLTLRPAVSS